MAMDSISSTLLTNDQQTSVPMKVEQTPLEGLLIVKPDVHGDARGFFLETFQAERYSEHGLPLSFVQDNLSRSRKGVLRGLHFQKEHPQGKLLSVIRGAVFDVAVDIRRNSRTFGKWHGVNLSEENHLQIFVPPGFAHGFCVTSDIVDFTYKCTDYYRLDDEYGIAWNDPDIAIEWPVENPVLSEKDQKLPRFIEIAGDTLPEYQETS